ncbi:N-alpha-acetyltransferase auxiliary subunit-like [Brachionus plicatilis]|uniref:N-alpha-acetyltransferase auxiliary subunit-like n=1 Tax=Brachionus plicatilis TaxID=10195 RepID=A0A3M7RPU5_BRAPC|nr:N-alpha-acetyltransferase auxiliary subunit-like [Brachionus plicatilis]
MEDPKQNELLKSLLNKSMKVKITDGRVLIGIFLCTDRDSNIVLGSCKEYTSQSAIESGSIEPRSIGLSMIPGQHIVQLFTDESIHS